MTNEQSSRRCVVWFGQPTAEECASLAQAGWRTRIGDAQLQDGVGMRRDDIVVALADLRRSDAGAVQAMGRLMDNHPWLPWLALILQETAADTPEVERILRASADFFTVPVDVKRLIDTLLKIRSGWSPASEKADIPVGDAGSSMSATTASGSRCIFMTRPLRTGRRG